MLKNLLFTLAILLGAYGVMAQCVPATSWRASITIENEVADLANNRYQFDLYLMQDPTSITPIYLANGDFTIDFDQTAFNVGSMAMNKVGAPPTGMCNFVPNNAAFALFVQFAYFGATLTSIIDDAGTRRGIINLNTINVSNIDNDAAAIDINASTHRLGTFELTGYIGGTPNLAMNYTYAVPTSIFTYDPASFDGSSYDQECVMLNGASLPVEILDFQATKVNSEDVKLNWVTSSELNNDRFVIEKKRNDGEFFPIGEVEGAGTTHTAQSYEHLDQTAMSEVVSYRLKQIDYDGSFSYSNVVELNFELSNGLFLVYPNPAREVLNIESASVENQAANYVMVDMSGRIVKQGAIENDVNISTLDVSDLANGVYLIRIKNNAGKAQISRFVKL